MSETSLAADAVPKKSRFPKAVPFIIGNEAAERFSYYGLRSILVTFLVAQFYSKIESSATAASARANEVTHLFVTLSYFMPLVGGILADWYFGKYKVILWISLVYCLGNLFTSSFTTSLPLFSTGLVLIAVGAGGIKSCVSANVGDQFDKSNQDLLSKVYGWFYFSINAGSMVSTVLIPTMYDKYGPRIAFGIPGILMALATIIFFSGRKMYVRVKPAGVNRNNFLSISAYASYNGRLGRAKFIVSYFIGLILMTIASCSVYYHRSDIVIGTVLWLIAILYVSSNRTRRCHDIGLSGWYQLIPFFYLVLIFKRSKKDNNKYLTESKDVEGSSWLDVAKSKFDPEKVEGMKAVYRVMSVFFFALPFWIVWDQNLSEWVLQAAKMNLKIGVGSWSFTMLPGQVQTFNPVFLLIFIPLFNYWVYPFFDKIGLKTTPLRRLGVGLVLTGVSFAIIAFSQSLIDHGATPSIWWQILAYVVLSAAEVLVSITGLEYAYTHSPKSMKSTMTAVWLMVVSMGNLITAAVQGNIADHGILEKPLTGAGFYWYFDVGLVAVFVIAFFIFSPHIKEHNYIENPEAADLNKIIADTDNL